MVDAIVLAIDKFREEALHLSKEEQEAFTNAMGDAMDYRRTPQGYVDVQRSVIIVSGQGQQVTNQYVMNLSAPYTWTGEISAEVAKRLLGRKTAQAWISVAATLQSP